MRSGGPGADADTETHRQLCAALRGEDVQLSDAVVELARRHRVHLLLADRARGRVSDAIAVALAAESRRAAAADLLRERQLRGVLDLLADAGVETLILKGGGLAYTVYASPHLRYRGDVDLLIRRRDVEPAHRALANHQWRPAVEQDREAATTQRHYIGDGRDGIVEHLDVHWKIAVPALFGDLPGFDEVAHRAQPIPALGRSARTPGTADALFLACVHRVAHHYDAVDLLWLWDIHLLAARLTGGDRRYFVDLAAARAMRAVCARGLELASASFATPAAAELIGALAPAAIDRPEPSAMFLRRDLRPVDMLRGDLQVLKTWRARTALIASHLFPSAAYMRSAYPRWPRAALPIAYVDRIVRGTPKWFRRAAE